MDGNEAMADSITHQSKEENEMLADMYYNMPDTCTSLRCTSYGCDYCKKCSHAIFNGKGKDANGKLWSWEFRPGCHSGPLFLRKDGKPLFHQPVRRKHPAWKPFMKWERKRFKK